MAVTFTLGTQFEVDANGGLARVATLTSSTAIALYSSAAAGIEARHLTNTAGTITGGAVLTIDANQADSVTICRLSDTSTVIGYCYGATHVTRVLTVAGTTLTANAVKNMTDTGVDYLTCEFLDTNKIIYAYSDSVNDGQSRVLTIAGTTITENAKFTFEATDTVIHCVVGVLDTSTAIVAWGDSGSDPFAEILDISGTTITGNVHISTSTVNIATTGHSSLDLSVSVSDSNYITVAHRSAGDATYRQLLSNSGGTLSRNSGSTGILILSGAAGRVANCVSLAIYKHSDGADPGYDLLVSASNETDNNVLALDEIDQWFGPVGQDTSISTTSTSEIHTRLFPGTTTGIVVWNDSTEAITITIPGAGFDLASMTKPADINADGTFIYLALLEGGTPILTKIATDLLSDGTTVFNPGAGDNIGVQCGKFNSDVVWVAGNFGGTDTVEKSENAGSSFVVKDPATFDPVTSFVVGPDSDDRVLVFADAGGSVASSNIQETTDSGASWDQKDSGLGFVSKAVERLDINVEEIVTGNEAGASDNIHYSPNTGEDLEDYSTGFPTQDVTKLIVG